MRIVFLYANENATVLQSQHLSNNHIHTHINECGIVVVFFKLSVVKHITDQHHQQEITNISIIIVAIIVIIININTQSANSLWHNKQ